MHRTRKFRPSMQSILYGDAATQGIYAWEESPTPQFHYSSECSPGNKLSGWLCFFKVLVRKNNDLYFGTSNWAKISSVVPVNMHMCAILVEIEKLAYPQDFWTPCTIALASTVLQSSG